MEEKMTSSSSFPGPRQLNLKKSFNRGLRSIVSACSDEEFRKAFGSCTAAERERLHALFVRRVIPSLHGSILEEVESVFLETKAGEILDEVGELVEEHNLDPLISQKSNLRETVESLSEMKRNEAKHLTVLLEKAEEQNRQIKERLERLKKENPDFSGAANLADKLRTALSNY